MKSITRSILLFLGVLPSFILYGNEFHVVNHRDEPLGVKISLDEPRKAMQSSRYFYMVIEPGKHHVFDFSKTNTEDFFSNIKLTKKHKLSGEDLDKKCLNELFVGSAKKNPSGNWTVAKWYDMGHKMITKCKDRDVIITRSDFL